MNDNAILLLCSEQTAWPCFRLAHYDLPQCKLYPQPQWDRIRYYSELLRTASPECAQISLSDTYERIFKIA